MTDVVRARAQLKEVQSEEDSDDARALSGGKEKHNHRRNDRIRDLGLKTNKELGSLHYSF